MRKKLLLVMLICVSLFVSINAQSIPMDAYFLAPDPEGVIQVWHWGESLQQITTAPVSIVDFAVSNDRRTIVYTSDGKLWQDPSHDVETTVITELDPEVSPSAFPVFRSDDSLLAFGNNGIYVYPLDGTTPSRVIENIPFNENTTDVSTLRFYFPRQFIPNSDWLILTIGLWEGWTTGMVNILTSELIEIEPIFAHYQLLPLSDGRLVVYGNNAVFGDPNVEITTPDKLNERTLLIDLTTVIPDTLIFVDQIIELEPGVLRILGYTFATEGTAENGAVMFDFDLNTNALVGEIKPLTLPPSTNPQSQSSIGTLSPDGNLLSIYIDATLNTELDGRGIVTGELVIYELTTGYLSLLPGMNNVSSLVWK